MASRKKPMRLNEDSTLAIINNEEQELFVESIDQLIDGTQPHEEQEVQEEDFIDYQPEIPVVSVETDLNTFVSPAKLIRKQRNIAKFTRVNQE